MRILLLASIAALHAACVDTTGPVTLEVESADRVGGWFTHHDIELRFELSRGDDAHRTRIARDDASSLLEIELVGSHQRATLLGGELVVDGELSAGEPVITGDLRAMAALERRGELVAIEALYDELDVAGVDPELVTPSVSVDGEARVIAAGEMAYVWTTFGSAPRTFELTASSASCTAVGITSIPGGREVTLVSGAQALRRYGWSGLIAIENIGAWTSWDDPVCGAGSVRVRVAP